MLFVRELDFALQQVNSDYEAKRYKDIALAKPVVHVLKKGVITDALVAEKLGKLGGQHKVPRLSNERKYLEEILSVASELGVG
jgi:hypothetical protein